MTETTDRGAVEAEITQLSRQIEEKRRMLEAEHSVVSDRELVRHMVAEKIGEALGQAQSAFPSTTITTTPTTPIPSYLDDLDDASVLKLNRFLQAVFEQGVQKTIKQVIEEDPFILDAFHDALTDKLYGELKKHHLVN